MDSQIQTAKKLDFCSLCLQKSRENLIACIKIVQNPIGLNRDGMETAFDIVFREATVKNANFAS